MKFTRQGRPQPAGQVSFLACLCDCRVFDLEESLLTAAVAIFGAEGGSRQQWQSGSQQKLLEGQASPDWNVTGQIQGSSCGHIEQMWTD